MVQLEILPLEFWLNVVPQALLGPMFPGALALGFYIVREIHKRVRVIGGRTL